MDEWIVFDVNNCDYVSFSDREEMEGALPALLQDNPGEDLPIYKNIGHAEAIITVNLQLDEDQEILDAVALCDSAFEDQA
jgi:hypothetical protein